MELRTVNVTRYIMPLREGGSLPALAEADDSFKYVVKFRGAGHGTKALIAELIGGEVARVLGFRVPELVFLNLDEAFGRSEGDEEIQDLLQGSRGLNMGLHFLSGALPFDPVVTEVDEKLASQVESSQKTSEARVMPGSGVQYVQRHIPPPSGWPARPSASIAAQFGILTHRIGMTTHAGTGRGAAALRRRAAACLVTA